VSDGTFAAPDLTMFTGLDELGLEVMASAWSRIREGREPGYVCPQRVPSRPLTIIG
jgi:hypothetical protein